MLRISLLLALLYALFTPSVRAQNLITNPGFETGDTTGWACHTNGVAAFAVDSTTSAGGRWSGRLTVTVEGGNVQVMNRWIALQSDTLYLLSFWAKSNSGHDLSVAVLKNTSPFTPYGVMDYRCDLTPAWQPFSMRFVATGFTGSVQDVRFRFNFAPFDSAGDVYHLDSVSLQRLPAPSGATPIITQEPADVGVYEGGSASFRVAAWGTPPLRFQWHQNGLPRGGDTTSSITLAAVSRVDSGSLFHCVVSNAFGQSATRSALLRVSNNLIRNPGFEQGAGYWTLQANGSASFTSSSVFSGYASSYSGLCSVQVVGTQLVVRQEGLRLRPQTRYRLAFRAYSRWGNDLRASVRDQDSASGGGLGLYRQSVPLGTRWTSASLLFVTPGFPQAEKPAVVELDMSAHAAAGDRYCFDDVYLEEVFDDQGRVAGVVTGEGRPLAGALVGITEAGGSWIDTTDDNGRFLVNIPVPAGLLSVVRTLVVYNASFDTARTPVLVTVSQTAQQNVVLSPTPPPGPPNLILPNPGAVMQPVPPRVVWGARTGVVRYHLQVAGDTSFGPTALIYQDSLGADTARTVAGAAGNSLYYWRVRSADAFRWGAWSAWRSFLTEGHAPLAPVLLTIPTLPQPQGTLLGVEFAYGRYWVTGTESGSPGDRRLSWFDPAGVPLGSAPQGTTSTFGWRDLAFDGRYLYGSDENEFVRIDTTGERVRPMPTPPGRTLLRALAFDKDRSLFWTASLSTTSAFLAFDTNGVVMDSIPNPGIGVWGLAWDGWSPGGPFLWTWSTEGPANGQKALARQFNVTTRQQTGLSFLGANLRPLPLADSARGATISPFVHPDRLVFLATQRSDPLQIVGYDLGPLPPIRTEQPLISVGSATTLTVHWNDVPGEAGYQIDRRFGSNGAWAQVDSVVAGTVTYTDTSLFDGAEVHYRVRTYNAMGLSQPSPTAGAFTPWRVPELVSATQTGPGRVVVNWTDPCRGETGFSVERKIGGATFVQIAAVSAQSTSFTDSTAPPGDSSAYRIRAFHQYSNSPASDTGLVLVVPRPPSPLPVAPANGATGQPGTVTLRWSASQYAESYQLNLSEDSLFAQGVRDTLTADSVLVMAGLQVDSVVYFWRIRARNVAGESHWSERHRFETAAIPWPPLIVGPSRNAVFPPGPVMLQWQTTVLPGDYRIQLDTSRSFPAPLADSAGHGDTAFTTRSLGVANWHWRVRATNLAGTGEWAADSFRIRPYPERTVLVFPPDGAANLPPELTLRWRPESTAVRYQVQVARDTLFAQSVVTDSIVTDTMCTIRQIPPGAWLFWRVRVDGLAGMGEWSDTSSFGSAPRPSTPRHLLPPDMSAGHPTTVELRWLRDSVATVYRVQLSADSTFDSGIIADSTSPDTSMMIGPLLPGARVFWRLQAAGIAGWGDRSEPWSFRIVTVPPPARLLGPDSGGGGVGRSVELAWVSIPTANSTTLEVGLDSSFAELHVSDSLLLDTTRVLSGLGSDSVYYWRIRGRNSAGAGDWSPAWWFKTAALPPAPMLREPADGDSGQPATVRFRWGTVSGALDYTLQVSVDSGFPPGSRAITLSDTTLILGDLALRSAYYWRVRVRNAMGEGGWSARREFRTTEIPWPTTLTILGRSGPVPPGQLQLAWRRVEAALTYQVQLSSDSSFGSGLIANAEVASETSWMTPNLDVGTYFARVRGRNDAGVAEWSDTLRIYVVALAQAPLLSLPPDGAVDQPLGVRLLWIGRAGDQGYHVQLATDTLFLAPVVDDSNLVLTALDVSGLERNTRYFWRVRSRNILGFGLWSECWQFRTLAPLAAPTPLLPQNGQSSVSLSPELRWRRSARATSYRLEIARDSSFGLIVFDDSTLTDSVHTVTSLVPLARYYWRVRAAAPGEVSQPSHPWWFSTASDLAIPQLRTPGSGSAAQDSVVWFRWNPLPGASQYGVEVAGDSAFSLNRRSFTVPGETTLVVHGLILDRQYFWRVRGENVHGPGPWSPASPFRTHPAELAVSFSHAFPTHARRDQYVTADYRLIGLPGASGLPLGTTVPGQAGQDWQAYTVNASGRYVAFTESDREFLHSVGRGFWLIRRGAWSVDLSVPFPPIDGSYAARVPWNPGWNIITNPFTVSVPWLEVLTANGMAYQPLHAWNRQWAQVHSLEAGHGYMVYRGDPAPDTLRIPLELPVGSPATGQVAAAGGVAWEGRLVYRCGDHVLAELRTGMDHGALDGIDPLDWRIPPPPGPIAEAFLLGSSPAEANRLLRDVRKERDSLHVWYLQSTGPTGCRRSVRAIGGGRLPPGWRYAFIDRTLGRALSAEEDTTYAWVSPAERHTLEFVAGPAALVDAAIADAVPREFALSNPFPNPFNPSTTVAIAVPRDAQVVLEVYGILGDRIATLYRGPLETGRWHFEWAGKNHTGETVSSGVYFLHCSVNGTLTFIQKALLIR